MLRIEEKVKTIQVIEKNGRNKADVCQEFDLINSTVQMLWKNKNCEYHISEVNGSKILQFWNTYYCDIARWSCAY